MQTIGKYIILFGLIAIGVGLLIYFFGNKFSWFGNLPGDIRMEKKNFKFYMPISSMLIVSIFLSLILWLIKKFFS